MRSIHSLVGTVGAEAVQALGKRFSRVRAENGFGNITKLALGFLLSKAVVLGGLSPFGVAFVAAQGNGAGAFFALLGAMFGYLFLGLDFGLRYMAIALLTFSAAMVFRVSRFSGKVWFMPLLAFAVSGATGLIYWAAQGAEALPLVLLVTELLLTAGAAYLFGRAYDKGQNGEAAMQTGAGRLLMVSCALLSLSAIELGTLSPARMAAVCAVMLLSFRGGAGIGAGAGVCMGLVMDLGLGMPFYSMSYGSSGLFSGVFRRAGKLWTALAFVGVGAITALWAIDSLHRLSVMLEFFVASVVFLMIPDKAFPGFTISETVETRRESAAHSERMRTYARQRLEVAASALAGVHSELKHALERSEGLKRESIEVVFDRTSKQVCQRCLTVSRCWDYEQAVTYSSIREAAALSEKRGWVERGDFPPHFATRCVHFKRFVETANREMSAMLYRRQFGSRINENRGQLCRQYAEFGRVIEQFAQEMELRFDSEAEKRLSRFLAGKQISADVEVYETPNGRMCARIEGDNLSVLLTDKRAFTREVSRVLGWLVSEPDAAGIASLDKLTLWETEPMSAILGIAAHKRDGQDMSGDSGTYFKNDDGKLFIILSDGMGSGSEAAYDSRQAVSLLEKLLKAGVEPESALNLLNSALCVKTADSSVFVTVDLMALDLLTGQLMMYKLGAAPTYVRHCGHMRKIGGNALPAGVDHTQSIETGKAQLEGGDWVVLITDGIADSGNDKWLLGMIDKLSEADTPRDLAARILGEAMREGGAADDMTALVLKTSVIQTRA